jgi:hypothetical protein
MVFTFQVSFEKAACRHERSLYPDSADPQERERALPGGSVGLRIRVGTDRARSGRLWNSGETADRNVRHTNY